VRLQPVLDSSLDHEVDLTGQGGGAGHSVPSAARMAARTNGEMLSRQPGCST
jgi:hypothetical protein